MKTVRLPLILVSLIVVLALVVSGVAAAPKSGASVSLSAAQTSYKAGQEVLISVTLSNPTGSTLRLLRWFTPVGGVEEPLFSLKRDGQSVGYTGALYKRPTASNADYISLKAGESLTQVVNLGDYYDLSRSGLYEITYSVSAFNLYGEKGNGAQYRDSLFSATLKVEIEGRAGKGGKPTPPPPPPGGSSYETCTVTQQADLVTARNTAKAYASESENYLFANNSGTSRYVTWFGLYTSSRYSLVRTHFTALSDAWDTAGVTFHCNCKQPYYAYVYPNQPYHIWVCKYFWLAPMSGTDSKGGTLIHEMSHFDVVASTDDFVYGQAGAKNLAITSPNDAVMNADNHEYFAENTPYLP